MDAESIDFTHVLSSVVLDAASHGQKPALVYLIREDKDPAEKHDSDENDRQEEAIRIWIYNRVSS